MPHLRVCDDGETAQNVLRNNDESAVEWRPNRYSLQALACDWRPHTLRASVPYIDRGPIKLQLLTYSGESTKTTARQHPIYSRAVAQDLLL